MAKKKPTKSAAVSKSLDSDGEIARQAEDRAELADKIMDAPFHRPANDPFPASAFPSEEAMFQSLGVRPDLVAGTLGTKTGQPISKAPAPFPTDPDVQGTKTGRTRDEKTNDGTNGTDGGMAGDTTQLADQERSENTGKVGFLESSSDSENVDKSIESELSSRVSRLPGEGRSSCHERLRRMARAAGMKRGQGPGTAYNWALEQTNILFAKLIEPDPEPDPPAEPANVPNLEVPAEQPEQPSIAVAAAPVADDGSVSGLSELPPGWPELPANAQLQVEIAWVTANRLRVRCGTGVDLSRALSPAPSYSALSWLETSILFPAKFADISVKATADQDSEKEFIKREKMAIEEIRSILKEMMEADD